MNLFVDTSVWSLALRRDKPSEMPAVALLSWHLSQGTTLVTTGLILQELLQGFRGPKQRNLILERFAVLPLIVPDLDDHVEASALHNRCRRRGIQIETIDALLAQLCIRHELTMLTTDRDFVRIASLSALRLLKN